MHTQNASERMAAHREFQQRLETLVLLLQAANEAPALAEAAHLQAMIGELQSGATDAGLPGVGELLRMWSSALQDVVRSGGALSSDDLLHTALWFMSLQEHVEGRLDANGRQMLAQMPEGIRWLPLSSPAFVRAIARKLDQSAVRSDGREEALDVSGADRQRVVDDSALSFGVNDDLGMGESNATTTAIDAARHDEVTASGALDLSPALLAQLPPEFLAAFPPGALDDLPSDVLQALLIETTQSSDMHPTVAVSIDDEVSAFDAHAFVVLADAETNSRDPSPRESTLAEHVSSIDAEAVETDIAIAIDDAAIGEVAQRFAADSIDAESVAAKTDTTSSARNDSESAFDFGVIGDDANPPNDEPAFDSARADGAEPGIGFDDAFADTDTTIVGAPYEEPAVQLFADASDGTTLNGTIWIGQEELDLTQQAVLDQLMPLAQAWTDTPDPEANAVIVEELSYQCQLLVNVMELIGTSTLAHGMDTVRVCIEARDPDVTPETLATWCSVLLAAIQQPNAESAELLAIAAQGLPGLDEAWRQALVAEFSRIRIGMDPALIAQRKTIAALDDIGLAPAEDVLPSVLDGMLRELPGNASRFGASVRALADTGEFESIDEARRIAHTLKGDANTVGIRGLANLTHALEDILIVLSKRPELLNAECADLLTNASDAVEEISDHLLGRGPAPENLLDTYQHVLDAANALADGADAVPAAAKPRTADDAQMHEEAREETLANTDAQPSIGATPEAVVRIAEPQLGMAASGIQSLNVPSALLDDLQRLAGESLVTARQIDRQLDGLSVLHREQRQEVRYTQELLGRLDDLVALRGAALQSTAQKTGADLDPLEIDQYNELHVISRQLIEAHADSAEFVRRIERSMNALADLRNEQELLNRDLQRTILQTRTVPFSQISARLQRIVRQTSKQVMKPVRLQLIGESIPLDAELLERVVEPLAHLLRNAVDHGIESPQRRRDAGKPEEGRIVLRVGLQGDTATIDLQDDGGGLDFDAIRARAIAAGLLSEDREADERLLTRLILLPGFSTRGSATEVSGRGIGMDVVNQRIAALRGTMTIASERDIGMRVALRLPVTQTLANVIVARGQHQMSAVVSSSVERVVSFAQGECVFDAEDGRLWVILDGERTPAIPIEHFYDAAADLRAWLDAAGVGLLARDREGRATVILVLGIDEVRSTVVKPISPYLPPIPAVRGITQLGDGSLAPVIDLDVMLQSAQESATGVGTLTIANAAPAIRVVVADDSLSVRRALEQLMQDAGYEVETARDGFEALAAIQAKPTHALLVDLEMPRMNGLEVTRNLRTHIETRELPVVMITSRATEKHQAMAEQAGVTRLLGKPVFEDGLVVLVRDLIANRAATEPTL
jgi:chemotaxis protein histidine kinase CheA